LIIQFTLTNQLIYDFEIHTQTSLSLDFFVCAANELSDDHTKKRKPQLTAAFQVERRQRRRRKAETKEFLSVLNIRQQQQHQANSNYHQQH